MAGNAEPGHTMKQRARKARVAASYFRKWAESRVGEMLDKPELCRPSMVCTILTSKCNYKCSFCNHPQMKQVDQMPLEKWQDILLQLKDWLGIYRINFLGGEPFLYPDLFPLLRFCKEQGIMAGITTNGWFLDDENCRKLGEFDLFNISMSVDGYGPEIHDKMRGIPGAHAKLWEGVENLRRHVIGKNGASTRVAFRTNVLAETLDDLVPLAHFVRSKGLHSIGFQPIEYRPMDLEAEWDYIEGKGTAGDSPNDRLEQFTVVPGERPENMDPHWVGDFDKLDRVIEDLKDLKQAGFPILNSMTHLDAIRGYYHNPSLIYEIKRDCKTAWEQMVILPDGNVRSCTELPPYGNLFERSPQEIWESDEAREHREKVAQCRRTCLNMFHWKRSLPEKIEMFTRFF